MKKPKNLKIKAILFTGAIFLTSALFAVATVYVLPSPTQYPASFRESDFQSKPWLQAFRYVVVINKATVGSDQQSVRVYQDGKLVQLVDVINALRNYQYEDTEQLESLKEQLAAYDSWGTEMPKGFSVSDTKKTIEALEKQIEDRKIRANELPQYLWSSGVFKISTGRNAFEKKGEHHSQKDSWTVTPTGYYQPQRFARKHKSEAYSPKLCDSILGKIWGSITQKEMCTNIEWAVFFNDSIATHRAIPGTEPILGQKASGGCVRLPGALAEFIYQSADRARSPIPVISKSGQPEFDHNGDLKYTESLQSIWGRVDSRSLLYIVHESR